MHASLGEPQFARLHRAAPLGLAAAIGAVAVIGSYEEAHPSSAVHGVFEGHLLPHTPALAFLLPAAAALALLLRKRWTTAVLAVSTACVLAYTLLGYVNGAAMIAPAVALYSLGVSASPRRAIPLGLIAVAGLSAATAARSPFGPTGGGFELTPVELGGALLVGLAVANRRAYTAALQLNAAERERRRVDEERVRIARELHDSIAHTMATINVQASVAAHLAGARADPAIEALKAIKAASREGLSDLRTILGVLRDRDQDTTKEPLPTLAELPSLVERAGQAGVATTVEVSGTPIPLPAATDAAAFRIIQESLTNAIRHSGASAARVSIAYQPESLEIDVRDFGSGSTLLLDRFAPGYGIKGMHERAAALGGLLEAGPDPANGFRVRAVLPIRENV